MRTARHGCCRRCWAGEVVIESKVVVNDLGKVDEIKLSNQ